MLSASLSTYWNNFKSFVLKSFFNSSGDIRKTVTDRRAILLKKNENEIEIEFFANSEFMKMKIAMASISVKIEKNCFCKKPA